MARRKKKKDLVILLNKPKIRSLHGHLKVNYDIYTSLIARKFKGTCQNFLIVKFSVNI